jgi:hypothetical protein
MTRYTPVKHGGIAGLLAFACQAAVVGCDRASSEVIPERVSDPTCRIELTNIATIGQETGDTILTGRPISVLRGASGRYWINILDAFPLIYDPRTRIFGEFGRRGGGPGEFRFAQVIAALPGDSMLIWDLRTFHVVASNLATARSVRSLHNIWPAAVLHWPDNIVAVSAPSDRATGAARTLVARYDLSADTVAIIDTVFQSNPGSGRGRDANHLRVLGTPTAGGHIWISDYNRYRLVLYSPTGEPLDSVGRTPRWFPGGGPDRAGAPDHPASPHTMGNWVDAHGRLWTLTAEPRKNTEDAWAGVSFDTRGVEGRMAAFPPAYRLKRTLIEVINPVQRRVVSRHTFDGYIIAVLPDNDVASFVETDAGVPVLTIHHLALRGCKQQDGAQRLMQ